jgi:hypothetical protein
LLLLLVPPLLLPPPLLLLGVLVQAAKADADVADSRDGSLPLHLAASLGRLDLVECLAHHNVGVVHQRGNHRSGGSGSDGSSGGGGVGSAIAAAAAAEEEEEEKEEEEERLQLRPRSYLQRQNRWGCTPHDLAFMGDHRAVVAFLGRCCAAGDVETQHVLDRNARLEREAVHRQKMEVRSVRGVRE